MSISSNKHQTDAKRERTRWNTDCVKEWCVAKLCVCVWVTLLRVKEWCVCVCDNVVCVGDIVACERVVCVCDNVEADGPKGRKRRRSGPKQSRKTRTPHFFLLPQDLPYLSTTQ